MSPINSEAMLKASREVLPDVLGNERKCAFIRLRF